jgi:hypothetical protein
MAHLALHIGRRPAAEFFCVIENLAHDLAPRFRIVPELALDEHRQAGGRDHEIVDRAGGRIQFGANRHRARKHRVDLGDRQARRVLVNERLDVSLAHRAAAGLLGDGF